MTDNFYEILDCEQDATTEEIKKKYQSLILKYHPDKQKEKNTNIYTFE